MKKISKIQEIIVKRAVFDRVTRNAVKDRLLNNIFKRLGILPK